MSKFYTSHVYYIGQFKVQILFSGFHRNTFHAFLTHRKLSGCEYSVVIQISICTHRSWYYYNLFTFTIWPIKDTNFGMTIFSKLSIVAIYLIFSYFILFYIILFYSLLLFILSFQSYHLFVCIFGIFLVHFRKILFLKK